jgi:hypothetical protein
VFLEQRQDYRIPLRDVETQRNLPRVPVVLTGSKGNVEAPFAVCKASEVIPNVGRYSANFEHDAPPGKVEPFLLIARQPRIFTATFFGS